VIVTTGISRAARRSLVSSARGKASAAIMLDQPTTRLG
jgi:hypothetical protein